MNYISLKSEQPYFIIQQEDCCSTLSAKWLRDDCNSAHGIRIEIPPKNIEEDNDNAEYG